MSQNQTSEIEIVGRGLASVVLLARRVVLGCDLPWRAATTGREHCKPGIIGSSVYIYIYI